MSTNPIVREKLAIDGGIPVRDEFLVFGKPQIAPEDIDEVVDSLQSGWISTGPKTHRFEKMFAEYVGARHSIALNSCTAGLHLALAAAGIGPGDEVITTPMTFAATANSIIHVGAKPVFVDIDPETLNLEITGISAAMNDRTKAIIPVHFAGRPCDMDGIMAIAGKQGLAVIEDAAHAAEAWHKERKVGAIGDATAFSFYVTKNIVTGEGGMLTTDRDDWAEKIKTLSLHGMSHGAWTRYSDKGFKHYEIVAPGYKYNMMDIQAAMGLHQLSRAAANLERRRQIWDRYQQAFIGQPVRTFSYQLYDGVHACHLYVMLIDRERLVVDRDQIQAALYGEGIGTGIHFVSLHLQPLYRDRYGYRPEDYPNAKQVSEATISLPLSAALTDQDVDDVITAVRKVLEHYSR